MLNTNSLKIRFKISLFQDIIRKHFWDKYQSEITGHAAYVSEMGFWSAYVRPFHAPRNESVSFVDAYSGRPMMLPGETNKFADGQPSNYR